MCTCVCGLLVRPQLHSFRIVCKTSGGRDDKRSKQENIQLRKGFAEILPGKQQQGTDDRLFEQRLEEIKSSGLEQKIMQEKKEFGPVDYSETPNDRKNNNVLLKVGAGFVVLGLAASFVLVDYLPTGRPTSGNSDDVNQLNPEQESKLKAELVTYEEKIKASPDDVSALEAAGVLYSELGKYKDAEAMLQKLTMINSKNTEAWRLLAEVRRRLLDYDGSISAYQEAIKASSSDSMALLRGLVEAFIEAGRPSEAVEELLNARRKVNKIEPVSDETSLKTEDNAKPTATTELDPVQVELLLGKVYSSSGQPLEAEAVYDQLTKKFPNDFRGYLARGVFLREQGRMAEADRMFIQARYFAPAKGKPIVDRFAK